MRIPRLSKVESSHEIEAIMNLNDPEFKKLIAYWEAYQVNGYGSEMKQVRNDLINAYTNLASNRDKSPYFIDLNFGLELYRILGSYGFSIAEASDPDIWRFLSIKVVPDIVFNRWKNKEEPQKLNIERFYENPKRIWLSILWWYIHLSFRDDLIQTKEILIHNGSDDISQLIERAGKYGYRVDLCREIMFHLWKINSQAKQKPQRLLSKVLQLNIVKSFDVEPEMANKDLETYVNTLFRELGY